MQRLILYILISLMTFVFGSFLVFKFNTQKGIQIADQKNTTLAIKEITFIQNISSPPIEDNFLNQKDEKCGEWDDDVDYKPIIRKWLRGEKFKDVKYCSKTGKETNSYNPSTVITPMLVDFNKDGKEELAIKNGCSATGNCDMVVFERVGKRYRQIFASVHGVNVFGLNKPINKGYYDVWANMHGGWNDGDRVVYRFNGKTYQPVKCFLYEYEEYQDDNGETKSKDLPTLETIKCSKLF